MRTSTLTTSTSASPQIVIAGTSTAPSSYSAPSTGAHAGTNVMPGLGQADLEKAVYGYIRAIRVLGELRSEPTKLLRR